MKRQTKKIVNKSKKRYLKSIKHGKICHKLVSEKLSINNICVRVWRIIVLT